MGLADRLPTMSRQEVCRLSAPVAVCCLVCSRSAHASRWVLLDALCMRLMYSCAAAMGPPERDEGRALAWAFLQHSCLCECAHTTGSSALQLRYSPPEANEGLSDVPCSA